MLVAIHQPQFLPWCGYFDKMDQADMFVLLDDVQFRKNEWQNRNRIKGPGGPQWLTVPVHYRLPQTIREVTTDDSSDWRRKHLQALRSCYGAAPCAGAVLPALERAYAGRGGSLADVNLRFLEAIRDRLGIRTPMRLSSTIRSSGERSGRLVSILETVRATAYLSGAGALEYLDPEPFRAAGIEVRVQRYEPAAYPQRFGAFVPALSVVDLLANCGPEGLAILRAGRRTPRVL